MVEKLTSLNRYISVITNFDETWFAIFENTINHLSFGYVCLAQLENNFSGFASSLLLFSFFFFFFFPYAIYF